MNARELATLLLKAPEARVVGVCEPDALWPLEVEITDVALNNEANAWILTVRRREVVAAVTTKS